jgi:hypothetical protein
MMIFHSFLISNLFRLMVKKLDDKILWKPTFVKFDENVATVPFNVPFKVPPLKGRFSEDSLAMNQKVGSYYPLLFVVE